MASKAGTFVFGLVMGVLIGFAATVGAIAGVAYYGYSKLTIKQVEGLAGIDITFLDGILGADSEFESMSIEQLLAQVGAIPEMTLPEFASRYNVTLPESFGFLSNALKDVPIYMIPDSAVDVLMTQVKIGELLGSPYNDYEKYPLEESVIAPEGTDKFMWELRGYAVMGDNGVSQYMDNVNVGTLRNVFGLGLPEFMNAIPDETKLSELGDEVNNIEIRSLITNPQDGEDGQNTQGFSISDNIMSAIHRAVDEDDKPYTLGNMDGMFAGLTKTLTVSDLLERPNEDSDTLSDKIILKIIEKGSSLEDLGGDIGEVMNDLEMADVLDAPNAADADKPTGKLIAKLRGINSATNNNYKVSEMSSVIDNLVVSDLFGEDEGITQLIGGDTKLNDMQTKLKQEVQDTALIELHEMGFLVLPANFPEIMKNYNLTQLLDYIASMSNH